MNSNVTAEGIPAIGEKKRHIRLVDAWCLSHLSVGFYLEHAALSPTDTWVVVQHHGQFIAQLSIDSYVTAIEKLQRPDIGCDISLSASCSFRHSIFKVWFLQYRHHRSVTSIYALGPDSLCLVFV